MTSTHRKKPVEIEARLFESADDGSILAEWCGGTNGASPEQIQIPTLEGTMTASLGDWIIKGVAGEFYPCKPDIFEQTYEPIGPRPNIPAISHELPVRLNSVSIEHDGLPGTSVENVSEWEAGARDDG